MKMKIASGDLKLSDLPYREWLKQTEWFGKAGIIFSDCEFCYKEYNHLGIMVWCGIQQRNECSNCPKYKPTEPQDLCPFTQYFTVGCPYPCPNMSDEDCHLPHEDAAKLEKELENLPKPFRFRSVYELALKWSD